MDGCGDGVIFGSDAEVGALLRVHGETEPPSQNGNAGVACSHSPGSLWVQVEGEGREERGEHISQQ